MTSAGGWSQLLTRLLRHPAAMRVKRVVRDVTSSVGSSRLSNPAPPANVRSVVFVCLGNICRSPFAGRLAAERLSATGIDFGSAGISAKQSNRCPDEAHEAAARFGVSLADHQPLRLTRAIVDAADLLVAMEAAQVDELRRAYPDAAARIVLLPLFDGQARGFDRFCIADPFMRPVGEFVECFERIERALAGLATYLDIAAPRSARSQTSDAAVRLAITEAPQP